jgi:hypothetical protein
MKKHLQGLLRACVLWIGLGMAAVAGAAPLTVSFSLEPASGAIQGQAGQTVGWGYKLVNEDADRWFVPTALSASSFSIGTPDASFFDFPILAPSQVASMAFDATAHTGLYGFAISPFALVGQSNAGSFTLVGEWWAGDPFADGVFLFESEAFVADFVVSVIGTPGGTVPVAPSILLMLVGALLLAGFVRARQPRQ